MIQQAKCELSPETIDLKINCHPRPERRVVESLP